MKRLILLGVSIVVFASCNSNTKKTNLVATNQDSPQLKESMERGKIVYEDMCITCHLPDGKGVPRAFPPLADSDYLRNNQTKSIKAAKYGMSGEIVVNGIIYNSTMAPLGLSDEEVADVINYINNSWGNTIDHFVTPEKVSKL
ncbi:c-type cytochrome [Winogradskyella helgolandensis]|uniref:c-type cytochrome n=1 Tax=Winogradskyella helgolandensis TaxID=2697010 RepID=UPI0015C06B04|nr:cytochrome c [Winogradskyella helgolandensis]